MSPDKRSTDGNKTTIYNTPAAQLLSCSVFSSLIDGAVIAPGLDGVLYAYNQQTGEQSWSYNTRRSYQGINGQEGNGGTLDAGGAVIADGLLLINSGYGGIVSAGGMEGNVLLVFSVQEP